MNLPWGKRAKEKFKKIFYNKKLSKDQGTYKNSVKERKRNFKGNKIGGPSKNNAYEEFMEQQGELFEKLNLDSKQRLLDKENVDAISKAITHFIFTNGPIEDMYLEEQISQDDMKKLNKYMVNKIAGLLTVIGDNDWVKLEMLLAYYRLYGNEWDKAEPDMKQIDFVFNFAVPKNF